MRLKHKRGWAAIALGLCPAGLYAQAAPAITPTTPSPASALVDAPAVPRLAMQSPPSPATPNTATSSPAQTGAATATAAITLEEAIHRAQANEPAFAASVAASRIAQLDRQITRNALLPTAVYHNQYLYTQPNGDTTASTVLGPSPRFIANNSVHEYISQAVVNETVGLTQAADLKLATATAARTAAEAELARRGLVATVVSLYYGELSSAIKLKVAQRAADESHAFTQLTVKREQGRESAHADVVRAQLLEQQRARDLTDATLAEERARLELAVLLFADPHTPYVLESGPAAKPLPSRPEIDEAARRNNPDLRAALAGLRESDADLLRARSAYLPDLALNVTYGIDAPQFATGGLLIPGLGATHVKNLGYSASATLDIPVWDWLSTQKRVKQSEIRRQVAQVALTAAQKRLIVELDEFYNEAASAQQQVGSLQQSVDTALESLRLTKLRYSAGEASALEVVDAQTALTLAENANADGQIRYRGSLANLQTLTGTL